MLIAAGWFATVLAALYTGTATTPEPPRGPDDCTVFGSCITPADVLSFLVLPVALGLLAICLPLAALARRMTASAVVAGTMTAGGTAGTAWVVITVLAAGR
ncbi:hypothetical protein ACIA8K_26430 [Catenuloplanes sp. NPDC051500]|uniref:hypothetical protein n=1 Tax=Catenuloplanes sp. NPDC051500 TaxID=3363959 RepID=UPI0037BD350A